MITSRRGAGRRGVLPGLRGGDVAPQPLLRLEQRRLEQRAGRCRARTRHSSGDGPWSAPNVNRPPAAAHELDGVGGHEVRHGLEADRERARRAASRPGRTRARSNAASIRSSFPQAPTTRRQHSQRARRRVQHRRRRPAARAVGERVRVRDEVEEVVRVQVRDHHHVDVVVVHGRAELREHAAAAVEQQPHPGLLDEVAGAGAVGVLPAGRLAEDREAHAVWHPTAR